jgi:carboxylesterase type B
MSECVLPSGGNFNSFGKSPLGWRAMRCALGLVAAMACAVATAARGGVRGSRAPTYVERVERQFLSADAAARVEAGVTVNVPGLGSVLGVQTAQERKFTSIPYGEAPMGALRWQQPVAAAAWAPSVLNATADPPGCPQTCELPPHTCPPVLTEDCLFLNVFTPVNATATSSLPVMVFIHGGNLLQGYSGGVLYDGSSIVSIGNVVLVTINYRLGALGFAYTGGGTITGSYGISDQRLALQWVQKYIAAFGGNPARVTIFGQSAGGVSVSSHMVAQESKGLFHAGIIESDPYTIPCRNPTEAATLANALGYYAGCDNSSLPALDVCLRGKTWEEIVAAQDQAEKDVLTDTTHLMEIFFPWMPIVDTTGQVPFSLPQQPMLALAAGGAQVASDVPYIVGTVSEEAIMFVYEAFANAVPEIEYDLVIAAIYGIDNGFKIGAQYPLNPVYKDDTRVPMGTIATPSLFTCATRHTLIGNLSIGGAGPVRSSPFWLYSFNHLPSFAPALWGANFSICFTHVCK